MIKLKQKVKNWLNKERIEYEESRTYPNRNLLGKITGGICAVLIVIAMIIVWLSPKETEAYMVTENFHTLEPYRTIMLNTFILGIVFLLIALLFFWKSYYIIESKTIDT